MEVEHKKFDWNFNTSKYNIENRVLKSLIFPVYPVYPVKFFFLIAAYRCRIILGSNHNIEPYIFSVVKIQVGLGFRSGWY